LFLSFVTPLLSLFPSDLYPFWRLLASGHYSSLVLSLVFTTPRLRKAQVFCLRPHFLPGRRHTPARLRLGRQGREITDFLRDSPGFVREAVRDRGTDSPPTRRHPGRLLSRDGSYCRPCTRSQNIISADSLMCSHARALCTRPHAHALCTRHHIRTCPDGYALGIRTTTVCAPLILCLFGRIHVILSTDGQTPNTNSRNIGRLVLRQILHLFFVLASSAILRRFTSTTVFLRCA
jgi:hypothetical protein